MFGTLISMAMNGLGEVKQQLDLQDEAENEIVNRVRNSDFIDIYNYCYGSRLQSVLAHPLQTPQTFNEEMAMTYEEYVVYLLNKYGTAKCDYFYGDTCLTKNPNIERLQEGLFCHHIAEECGISLKDMTHPDFARSKPYDLYSATHFVYCNYFEHLLLHIKIALEDVRVRNEQPVGIDLAGARMIWRELNRFYFVDKVPIAHREAAELVKDKYEEYLPILKWLLIDERTSKYCDAEDLSVDVNGVVVQKIYNDLN